MTKPGYTAIPSKESLPNLHKEVLRGKESRVAANLGASVNVNQEDELGRTALHYAAASGAYQIVMCICNRRGDVNLEVKDEQQKTPLIKAIEAGSVECVHLLITLGCKVRIRDDKGRTPLHFAAVQCSVEIFSILYMGGAELNSQDSKGLTALHIAASLGCYEITSFIIKHNANVNLQDACGRTPLMCSAGCGVPHLMKLLLQHGSSLMVKDKKGLGACDYLFNAGKCAYKVLENFIMSKEFQENLRKEDEKARNTATKSQGKERIVNESNNSNAENNKNLLDPIQAINQPCKTGEKINREPKRGRADDKKHSEKASNARKENSPLETNTVMKLQSKEHCLDGVVNELTKPNVEKNNNLLDASKQGKAKPCDENLRNATESNSSTNDDNKQVEKQCNENNEDNQLQMDRKSESRGICSDRIDNEFSNPNLEKNHVLLDNSKPGRDKLYGVGEKSETNAYVGKNDNGKQTGKECTAKNKMTPLAKNDVTDPQSKELGSDGIINDLTKTTEKGADFWDTSKQSKDKSLETSEISDIRSDNSMNQDNKPTGKDRNEMDGNITSERNTVEKARSQELCSVPIANGLTKTTVEKDNNLLNTSKTDKCKSGNELKKVEGEQNDSKDDDGKHIKNECNEENKRISQKKTDVWKQSLKDREMKEDFSSATETDGNVSSNKGSEEIKQNLLTATVDNLLDLKTNKQLESLHSDKDQQNGIKAQDKSTSLSIKLKPAKEAEYETKECPPATVDNLEELKIAKQKGHEKADNNQEIPLLVQEREKLLSISLKVNEKTEMKGQKCQSSKVANSVELMTTKQSGNVPSSGFHQNSAGELEKEKLSSEKLKPVNEPETINRKYPPEEVNNLEELKVAKQKGNKQLDKDPKSLVLVQEKVKTLSESSKLNENTERMPISKNQDCPPAQVDNSIELETTEQKGNVQLNIVQQNMITVQEKEKVSPKKLKPTKKLEIKTKTYPSATIENSEELKMLINNGNERSVKTYENPLLVKEKKKSSSASLRLNEKTEIRSQIRPAAKVHNLTTESGNLQLEHVQRNQIHLMGKEKSCSGNLKLNKDLDLVSQKSQPAKIDYSVELKTMKDKKGVHSDNSTQLIQVGVQEKDKLSSSVLEKEPKMMSTKCLPVEVDNSIKIKTTKQIESMQSDKAQRNPASVQEKVLSPPRKLKLSRDPGMKNQKSQSSKIDSSVELKMNANSGSVALDPAQNAVEIQEKQKSSFVKLTLNEKSEMVRRKCSSSTLNNPVKLKQTQNTQLDNIQDQEKSFQVKLSPKGSAMVSGQKYKDDKGTKYLNRMNFANHDNVVSSNECTMHHGEKTTPPGKEKKPMKQVATPKTIAKMAYKKDPKVIQKCGQVTPLKSDDGRCSLAIKLEQESDITKLKYGATLQHMQKFFTESMVEVANPFKGFTFDKIWRNIRSSIKGDAGDAIMRVQHEKNSSQRIRSESINQISQKVSNISDVVMLAKHAKGKSERTATKVLYFQGSQKELYLTKKNGITDNMFTRGELTGNSRQKISEEQEIQVNTEGSVLALAKTDAGKITNCCISTQPKQKIKSAGEEKDVKGSKSVLVVAENSSAVNTQSMAKIPATFLRKVSAEIAQINMSKQNLTMNDAAQARNVLTQQFKSTRQEQGMQSRRSEHHTKTKSSDSTLKRTNTEMEGNMNKSEVVISQSLKPRHRPHNVTTVGNAVYSAQRTKIFYHIPTGQAFVQLYHDTSKHIAKSIAAKNEKCRQNKKSLKVPIDSTHPINHKEMLNVADALSAEIKVKARSPEQCQKPKMVTNKATCTRTTNINITMFPHASTGHLTFPLKQNVNQDFTNTKSADSICPMLKPIENYLSSSCEKIRKKPELCMNTGTEPNRKGAMRRKQALQWVTCSDSTRYPVSKKLPMKDDTFSRIMVPSRIPRAVSNIARSSRSCNTSIKMFAHASTGHLCIPSDHISKKTFDKSLFVKATKSTDSISFMMDPVMNYSSKNNEKIGEKPELCMSTPAQPNKKESMRKVQTPHSVLCSDSMLYTEPKKLSMKGDTFARLSVPSRIPRAFSNIARSSRSCNTNIKMFVHASTGHLSLPSDHIDNKTVEKSLLVKVTKSADSTSSMMDPVMNCSSENNKKVGKKRELCIGTPAEANRKESMRQAQSPHSVPCSDSMLYAEPKKLSMKDDTFARLSVPSRIPRAVSSIARSSRSCNANIKMFAHASTGHLCFPSDHIGYKTFDKSLLVKATKSADSICPMMEPIVNSSCTNSGKILKRPEILPIALSDVGTKTFSDSKQTPDRVPSSDPVGNVVQKMSPMKPGDAENRSSIPFRSSRAFSNTVSPTKIYSVNTNVFLHASPEYNCLSLDHTTNREFSKSLPLKAAKSTGTFHPIPKPVESYSCKNSRKMLKATDALMLTPAQADIGKLNCREKTLTCAPCSDFKVPKKLSLTDNDMNSRIPRAVRSTVIHTMNFNFNIKMFLHASTEHLCLPSGHVISKEFAKLFPIKSAKGLGTFYPLPKPVESYSCKNSGKMLNNLLGALSITTRQDDTEKEPIPETVASCASNSQPVPKLSPTKANVTKVQSCYSSKIPIVVTNATATTRLSNVNIKMFAYASTGHLCLPPDNIGNKDFGKSLALKSVKSIETITTPVEGCSSKKNRNILTATKVLPITPTQINSQKLNIKKQAPPGVPNGYSKLYQEGKKVSVRADDDKARQCMRSRLPRAVGRNFVPTKNSNINIKMFPYSSTGHLYLFPENTANKEVGKSLVLTSTRSTESICPIIEPVESYACKSSEEILTPQKALSILPYHVGTKELHNRRKNLKTVSSCATKDDPVPKIPSIKAENTTTRLSEQVYNAEGIIVNINSTVEKISKTPSMETDDTKARPDEQFDSPEDYIGNINPAKSSTTSVEKSPCAVVKANLYVSSDCHYKKIARVASTIADNDEKNKLCVDTFDKKCVLDRNEKTPEMSITLHNVATKDTEGNKNEDNWNVLTSKDVQNLKNRDSIVMPGKCSIACARIQLGNFYGSMSQDTDNQECIDSIISKYLNNGDSGCLLSRPNDSWSSMEDEQIIDTAENMPTALSEANIEGVQHRLVNSSLNVNYEWRNVEVSKQHDMTKSHGMVENFSNHQEKIEPGHHFIEHDQCKAKALSLSSTTKQKHASVDRSVTNASESINAGNWDGMDETRNHGVTLNEHYLSYEERTNIGSPKQLLSVNQYEDSAKFQVFSSNVNAKKQTLSSKSELENVVNSTPQYNATKGGTNCPNWSKLESMDTNNISNDEKLNSIGNLCDISDVLDCVNKLVHQRVKDEAQSGSEDVCISTRNKDNGGRGKNSTNIAFQKDDETDVGSKQETNCVKYEDICFVERDVDSGSPSSSGHTDDIATFIDSWCTLVKTVKSEIQSETEEECGDPTDKESERGDKEVKQIEVQKRNKLDATAKWKTVGVNNPNVSSKNSSSSVLPQALPFPPPPSEHMLPLSLIVMREMLREAKMKGTLNKYNKMHDFPLNCANVFDQIKSLRRCMDEREVKSGRRREPRRPCFCY